MSIHLSPSSSVEEDAPSGYNIYRDGTRVNDIPVAELTYQEELSAPGTYNYQVSSVYDNGGESSLSDATQVKIIDLGKSFISALVRDLFLNSSKSLKMRLSKVAQSSAGFKYI